jgi:hypothetical protein
MLGAWRKRAEGADDDDLARIRAVWGDVVGEVVAACAQPVRRSRAGLVTVACADAVWAQTLSSQGDDILDRLYAAAGGDALAGLRFVPDEHALRSPAQPTPPPPSRPPITREEMAAAERLVEGVADPTLRELLARAAARAPARGERPKCP